MAIDWHKPVRVVGDHRLVHVLANPYVENPGDPPAVLIRLLPKSSEGEARVTDGTPFKLNLDGTPFKRGQSGCALTYENFPEKQSFYFYAAPPRSFIWNDKNPNLRLTWEGSRLLTAEVIG